jgi:hypothetical protein
MALEGTLRATWVVLTLAGISCGSDESQGSQTPATGVAGGPATASAGRAATPPAIAGTGASATAGRSAGSSAAGSSAPAPSAGGAAGGAGTGAAGVAGAAAVGGGAGGGGGAVAAAAGGAAPVASGSKLKPVTSIAEDGPYPTTVDDQADGGAGYLVYPTDLGADGVKHPIFVWGTGSGSLPVQYNMHLVRLASHGFVVYSADTDAVTGALLTRGIDFLFAEAAREGSPLYQKLDLTKLGVGGHSLGSLSTYDIAEDPRITTTVHVDGGQFDGMGGPRLHKPAIFICGEDSWGTPNCNADYEGSSIPIFYTRIAGLIGAEGHIMAADAGLEVWLAWLRWQLAGEEERRKDFLDPMCAFCTGKYDSQSKNW